MMVISSLVISLTHHPRDELEGSIPRRMGFGGVFMFEFKGRFRQFGIAAEYIRNSAEIYNGVRSDDDIKRLIGVPITPSQDAPYDDLSSEAKAELRRIKGFAKFNTTRKANLVMLEATYAKVLSEINDAMNKEDALGIKRVKQSSTIKRQVASNRTVVATIEWGANSRVAVSRFPSTFTLRSPALGQPAWHPRRPYINKGTYTGNIHDGASKYFKRYAYRSVTIFKKKYSGTRMGRRFPGLGYEPIGIKPKSAGQFPRDYQPFIRAHYPFRSAVKDRLLGSRGRIPVFLELYDNKRAVKRINKTVNKAVLAYLRLVDQGRIAAHGKFTTKTIARVLRSFNA